MLEPAEFSLAAVEHELRCVGDYLNRITKQRPRSRHTQAAMNAANSRLRDLQRKRAHIISRIEGRREAS